MNKDFVPYEVALALKELGFDEPCFRWYDKNDQEYLNDGYCKNSEKWLNGLHCSAPTFSQAFRFFREKYNLFGCIDLSAMSPSYWFVRIDRIDTNDYLYHSIDEDLRFETYEEAELECLIKLIKIVDFKLEKL
jgi:hypothetical protein